MLLIASLISLLGGCGYQFQGSGTSLPDDVRAIYIAPVRNDTTELGLSNLMTEALRLRFERYGIVHTVDSARDADAVLQTRVRYLDSQVRNVTGDTDIALELDLVMIVSSELKRRGGQSLWKNSYLETRKPFASVQNVVVTSSSGFASGDVGSANLGNLGAREVSRGQQEQATQELIEETARRVYLGAVAEKF
ncbi:MAG: LPS assembly lipoprotein LptE [bacterium]|nr:LPS assembly lipoprotein LptE [bacterium]